MEIMSSEASYLFVEHYSATSSLIESLCFITNICNNTLWFFERTKCFNSFCQCKEICVALYHLAQSKPVVWLCFVVNPFADFAFWKERVMKDWLERWRKVVKKIPSPLPSKTITEKKPNKKNLEKLPGINGPI